MVVLKNLSERIKFLKTKEGIITFKSGEEKEIDCNLINLKNLPNNLVIKNDQEDEVKIDKDESRDYKWIDLKELYNMIENGEIAWVLIPRIEEYVIPLMKETN